MNASSNNDTQQPLDNEGQGAPEASDIDNAAMMEPLRETLEVELQNQSLDQVPEHARPEVRKLLASLKLEMLNGKPVLYYHGITVLNPNSEEFFAKLLCDLLVFNLGMACGFGCVYCYVEAVIRRLVKRLINRFNREHRAKLGRDLKFDEIQIRRKDAINLLRAQLVRENGSAIFDDPTDTRVVYTSTLVDPASSMELLRETAEACKLILEHTHWQIRILSKSSLLASLIRDELIPRKYHHRLILGFSIGTLDDKVAAAIEKGTSRPSPRLKALHWLQDQGIRTFGMICPSLPQADYETFSKEICEAIRVEKCEHVWGEVINVRGKTYTKTRDALLLAELKDEVERLDSVFGPAANEGAWEDYARRTFLAHTRNVPAYKLRFLQYLKEIGVEWWAEQRSRGAVLIGSVAKKHHLLAVGESAPREPLPDLTDDDRRFLSDREVKLSDGVNASITAAAALHEIHSYKNGLLWKKEHHSFDEYCQAKWGYAKAHGYRLLGAGRFVSGVLSQAEANGIERSSVALPRNEAQIRPILSIIPEEHQADCWNHIVEQQSPETLTQAKVEALAKQFATTHKLKREKSSRGKIKPSKVAKAHRTLSRLSEMLEDLPEPGRFTQLLKGIEILLDQTVEATPTGETSPHSDGGDVEPAA